MIRETESAQFLTRLYDSRFDARDRAAKDRLWGVLVGSFLQRYVNPEATIVDVAGGFGEFADHVKAKRKIVLDLNPEANRGSEDVEYRTVDVRLLPEQRDLLGIVDVVFVSNFFEHLASSDDFLRVLSGCRAILKPGGTLLAIQPNFKYCYREYYDFLDHTLPVTDGSMREALTAVGFSIDELTPQFLPFSTKGFPSSPFLLRAYLKLRPAWRIFGSQMFVRAHRP